MYLILHKIVVTFLLSRFWFNVNKIQNLRVGSEEVTTMLHFNIKIREI